MAFPLDCRDFCGTDDTGFRSALNSPPVAVYAARASARWLCRLAEKAKVFDKAGKVNAAGAAWDCRRGLSPESSSSSSASFELDFSSPPRGPDYSPLIIPCPGSSGQSSLHSPSLENTAGSPLVLSPPRNYTASPLSLTTSPLGLTASPLRLRTSPPALTASPLGRSTSPLGLRTSPLGLTTSPLGLTTSPLGLTTSALGLALSVSPASQPCRSPAFESCARPASPMEDARSFLTRTFFSDEEHPASTSGTGLVGHSRFLGASEPASTWGPRRSPPQVGWVDVASQRPPPRLDCDLAQGIERTTRSLNASFGRVSSVRFASLRVFGLCGFPCLAGFEKMASYAGKLSSPARIFSEIRCVKISKKCKQVIANVYASPRTRFPETSVREVLETVINDTGVSGKVASPKRGPRNVKVSSTRTVL
ncbi:uncharacterized protein ISCGN_031806 [Ixodes scapularis]